MSHNKVETEYLDIVNRSAWSAVYQKIGQESQNFQYTFNEAKKPENKPLNRYRDVNPYDHTRIILKRIENDYINANLVKMERANRKYILTQGPLMMTAGHFWLMVWEQDSRAILMLNKVIEKCEMKCHWYWPQGLGDKHKMTLEDEKLIVELVNETDCGYFSTRMIRIQDMNSSESREVIQFHYTTWPDFGVPSSPVAFLDFLKKVRESGTLDPDVGPPIVHCSAGIGRSGTFCLVDSCLVIAEKEGVENISIQDVLVELRKGRMGLIQTPDQLRFSYQAIIEGTKRLDPNRTPSFTKVKVKPLKLPPVRKSAKLRRTDKKLGKREEFRVDENIYAVVAEEAEEEAPPPPPPRAESLTRAPARPLPAIPTSSSMGELVFSTHDSSSDESPPTPPAREFATSSADDEDDDPVARAVVEADLEASESVRRRRNRDRELADRVSNMKRRARDSERWQSFKRSIYKPLSITFGFIIAGIVIYSYAKH